MIVGNEAPFRDVINFVPHCVEELTGLQYPIIGVHAV